MELRHYWDIIRWHWRLVLLVPLVVGLGGLALALRGPTTYTATAKVNMTLIAPRAATPAPGGPGYDDYHAYRATEYAIDDLVEAVNGNVFAAAVARTAQGAPVPLPLGPQEVRGALAGRRVHRALVIQAQTQRREWAAPLVRAAVQTLERELPNMAGEGQPQLRMQLIDEPHQVTSDWPRRRFNIALWTALALAAAIGLAFLIESFADRQRESTAEMLLGLPILGRLPEHPPVSTIDGVRTGDPGAMRYWPGRRLRR